MSIKQKSVKMQLISHNEKKIVFNDSIVTSFQGNKTKASNMGKRMKP